MNIFHTILQKIGIEKPAAPAAPAPAPYTPVSSTPAAVPYTPVSSTPAPAPSAPAPVAPAVSTPAPVTPATFVPAAVGFSAPPSAAPAAPAKPTSVPMVDVVSKLEALAKSHPGLDWKVSIVDLLKLVDMDSSFEARKSLATELDCPANMLDDSARMNVWLHKTVLQKIAENGGNIPASLLN